MKVVNWEKTEEQDTKELHPLLVTTIFLSHGRETCGTTSGVIDAAFWLELVCLRTLKSS